MEKAPLKNIEDFCKALEYYLGSIHFGLDPEDSIVVRMTKDTAKDLIRYLKRLDVIKCARLIPEHLIVNIPSGEIEEFEKREIAYEIANQLLENNYFEFLCREPSVESDPILAAGEIRGYLTVLKPEEKKPDENYAFGEMILKAYNKIRKREGEKENEPC